jgi:Fic-DOC domain mobile mystery protein B
MSDLPAPQDDRATDLSPEEREGLIPSYITTRAELNEAEQGNILGAREWSYGKNIGIDAYQVPTDLRNLIDDVRYWIDHRTYPADEIVARFHHRLALIHCYRNGNGRHARMATDLLLDSIGHKPFTWGNVNLVDPAETRDTYIAALRAADRHDIAPLIAFVRT